MNHLWQRFLLASSAQRNRLALEIAGEASAPAPDASDSDVSAENGKPAESRDAVERES